MNDNLLETNMSTLKEASTKALELLKGLYDFKFFNKDNYEKNIETFQFVLVEEDETKLFSEGQFALYVAKTNAIYVKEDMLRMGVIDKEQVTKMLLHELVHMASANRKRNRVGFNHEASPITYNEGCTQYLTLKLYDKENFDKEIENNIMYPQSTKIVKECVDDLGEETIFKGFFEANLRKSVYGFSPKTLDRWIDYVMKLSNTLEEKISKENNERLVNKIEEAKGTLSA